MTSPGTELLSTCGACMYSLAQCFPSSLTSSRLEQNIAVVACSIPALQPLFKAFHDRTPVLSTWEETTVNKFSSRSRNFHPIKINDTNSDSEEQILPSEHETAVGLRSPTEAVGKGIRKTTDVELFYHDAGVAGNRQSHLGKDKPIEMI